jgi:hypothetical protein
MLPPPAILRAVTVIHAAPPRLVYIFAGAGSLALYWLHAPAGSSRTVLEALDCYAPQALAEAAGGVPAQAVSAETVTALATRALARAATLSTDEGPLLGVACTAAIATERARRGADRAFVAVCGSAGCTHYALTLREAGVAGGRDRYGQEELASRLVLYAIARACGLDLAELQLALRPGETLVGG